MARRLNTVAKTKNKEGGHLMGLKERVYSVLLVSAAEKFNTAMSELLPVSRYSPVTIVSSVSEAKRQIAERSYDFILINSPLPDESGIRFSIDCCHSKTAVVMLLVKNEIYAETHERVAVHGVFTTPKPTSKAVFKDLYDGGQLEAVPHRFIHTMEWTGELSQSPP